MTCSRCGDTDLSPANLTRIGDQRVCPLCVYQQHEGEMRRENWSRPSVSSTASAAPDSSSDLGLVVEDLPRRRSA